MELKPGDAQDLDLPDGSFDTVVATLLLSTIPDPRRAGLGHEHLRSRDRTNAERSDGNPLST